MMKKLFLAAVAAAVATSAQAAPTSINLGGFSGSETVIDSTVANDVEITNQYAAQGIAFSGGLYGNTDSNYLPSAGAPETSNFLGGCGCGDITVSFSSLQTRFGLYIYTNPTDDLTLSVFNGATLLGSVNYTTGTFEAFAGIQELSGFDRVLVNVNGSDNGAFAADGYRFESTLAQVPEPATLGLVGFGMLGIAAGRRRTAA